MQSSQVNTKTKNIKKTNNKHNYENQISQLFCQLPKQSHWQLLIRATEIISAATHQFNCSTFGASCNHALV